MEQGTNRVRSHLELSAALAASSVLCPSLRSVVTVVLACMWL